MDVIDGVGLFSVGVIDGFGLVVDKNVKKKFGRVEIEFFKYK